MKLVHISLLILIACATANAQSVKRYNFGKPATVISYIKEVITWKDGKKENAESFAGNKNEIYLSDSLIRVTEVDTVYEFLIMEIKVDDFGNVSFFQENGTILHWFRHRRIFQIEPGSSTQEILYYVE